MAMTLVPKATMGQIMDLLRTISWVRTITLRALTMMKKTTGISLLETMELEAPVNVMRLKNAAKRIRATRKIARSTRRTSVIRRAVVTAKDMTLARAYLFLSSKLTELRRANKLLLATTMQRLVRKERDSFVNPQKLRKTFKLMELWNQVPPSDREPLVKMMKPMSEENNKKWEDTHRQY